MARGELGQGLDQPRHRGFVGLGEHRLLLVRKPRAQLAVQVATARLAQRAGSLDVGAMTAAAESLSYAGPRGELQMTADRHVDQRVYLAEAVGLGFDLVTELEPPRPGWGA